MIKDLLNKYYDRLSENDLYVLDYISNHIEKCKQMSITELAEACAISKSSILRMTQKLGFSGYSEFKYSLKHELELPTQNIDFTHMQLNEIEMTRKLFDSINKTAIYEKINSANTIYGFATGWGQRNALEELSRHFILCKKKLFIIPAVKEFEILLPKIEKNDLVIFISLSGDVQNIVSLLRQLSIKKVPSLSITSFNNNHLAELSTFNIYYQSTDLGYYHSAEQKSFMGLFTVIDLLYRGYLNFSLRGDEES
ncbi:MurR/RpiR family transcriptional regulator [Robertmurraya massiliosenegalensis]|uniref:MurR/RpiR family transcriptional regulator n=1 Tax=Robertmurraya TaxID=2837507 RepID=UPI0039A57ECD